LGWLEVPALIFAQLTAGYVYLDMSGSSIRNGRKSFPELRPYEI
jgi:hypothetical protein